VLDEYFAKLMHERHPQMVENRPLLECVTADGVPPSKGVPAA
jgi:hypothetical protein